MEVSMKCGIGAALAVGAGYVLGRRRKMRTAVMLAGATAAGGVGGLGGSLLKRGVKALGSSELLDKASPQLGEITDRVRGELLDAGKAAALAAVTGRIDSLTDSLHDRADTLRAPARQAADAAGEAAEEAGEAGEAAQGLRRRARPQRPADRDSTEAPPDEDRAEPEDADDFDDEDEFEEPRPAPARRRTQRERSPVSRARR
jgi:hypothetical protein